jgi:hypothetical protein
VIIFGQGLATTIYARNIVLIVRERRQGGGTGAG